MIDRTLLDAQGRDLLTLERRTLEQAMHVRAEGLPELSPVGEFVDVPGTGVRLYVGGDAIKGGAYTLSVGVFGRTHSDAFDLHREVMRAAVQARAVQRSDGGVLRLARFSRVSRAFTGSAQQGGAVDATWEVASPYWWTPERTLNIPEGQPTPVLNAGEALAPLRVTITAGGAPVTQPSILTDMGLTRFLGTVPPGATLTIDGLPGRWSTTLDGADAHLKLTGPQPALLPGERTVTVTAPGSAVQLAYQEGRL